MMFVKGTKYLVKHRVRASKFRYFVGVYVGLDRYNKLTFSLLPVATALRVDAATVVSYIETVQPCGVKNESKS